jgi:CPA1 family monovalent cation:H+ antiporter
MDRLQRAHHVHYAIFAIAILVTVIVVRVGWTMLYYVSLRIVNFIFGDRTPRTLTPAPFEPSLLAAWCGMRGIVTLATALALPEVFPYRDLIVLTAFAVVLGTLVLQGFTLRMLVTKLALEDDASVENEIRGARSQVFAAARDSLDGRDSHLAVVLRREYSEMLKQIDGSPEAHQTECDLRATARNAARERLHALRVAGAIGEAAFQELQTELDLLELAEVRSRS